jgi:hypothetical protein
MPVRPVNPMDQAVLANWIARDPAHSGVMTPEFYMSEDAQCLVYEAFDGLKYLPALYIRLEPVSAERVRAYVQFPPWKNPRDLVRAFRIVKETLAKAGFHELVFDSVSPTLVRFCQRRMGFVAEGGNEYVARF